MILSLKWKMQGLITYLCATSYLAEKNNILTSEPQLWLQARKMKHLWHLTSSDWCMSLNWFNFMQPD